MDKNEVKKQEHDMRIAKMNIRGMIIAAVITGIFAFGAGIFTGNMTVYIETVNYGTMNSLDIDYNNDFSENSTSLAQANFSISKNVRINNDRKRIGGWLETVKAQPGDTLDFLIEYTNTGTIQQNNVVIKDIMPDYLVYIEGSTFIYNATNPTSTGGLRDVTDKITEIGINIGNYAPGANALVKFSVHVVDNGSLPFGEVEITNTGRAETDNGSKEATVEVIIVQ